MNISFQRGKKTASGSYSLEDGFSVFDKIKNTPTYWRQAKYEMLAKLENLGPFQFFFTLSSADSRWDENFSSLLRNLGVAVRYEMDSKGKEDTKVIFEGEPVLLRDYLKENIDDSQHELIRKSILNATRNYNQRVKAFIKDIVLDKNNPMAIKYYSTKVEFQGRGAAHNHGTLWADLKRMENYIGDAEGSWKDIEQVFEEEKQHLSKNNSNSISSFSKHIKKCLKLQQMQIQPENKGISDDKERKCYEDSIELFFSVFVDSEATFDEG